MEKVSHLNLKFWNNSNFENNLKWKVIIVLIWASNIYAYPANLFNFICSSLESSGGYTTTSNAFIFSLRNKEGLGPFKSMVTRPSNAIYSGSTYGPVFGGGCDILIADNANSNSNSYTNFGQYYSVPSGVQDGKTILAGTYKFSPDEVEVFYLG